MFSKVIVQTVNVLEIGEGTPNQIISYKDNKAGNKLAEKVFTKMAMENGADEENIDQYLEDGSYENGTYGLYLIHSN